MTVKPRMRQGIGLYLMRDVSPLAKTYALIQLLLLEVNMLYKI